MSTVVKTTRHPLPVRIEGVTKAFGAFVALDDVSLTVPAGSVTALIGASGSGKSTLLRCVNGLEQVDGGQIHVGDVRTGVAEDGDHTRPWTESEASEARRRIGVVFQQFNLFPHCTVLENVTLAQRVVLGRSATEAAEIARLHLERLGLAAKVDAYPKRLSGGEQQRVAIARALAMDPGLILFDEPTSALDPERTLEVLAAMRELATDGITMVVVTHEMRFARDVSDQVVLMDHGRVIETGTADAIFEDPREPLTRRFLQKHLDTPRTTRKDGR